MRHAVLASLLTAALSTLPVQAAERDADAAPGTLRFKREGRGPCVIQVGPNDRVAQDADLVIPPGAVVESAVALRGSVIIRGGARVKKAVAAGGSVRVEGGAQVGGEVVAIGGDVLVAAQGRVDGEAVSLGGRVRIAEGGSVVGSVTSLSLQLAGLDLEREVREQLGAAGKCRVEPE
jgi:cytoskeletal protein CcmA (bactofilin family)